MPKFKIGDYVEVVGVPAADDMREGTVIRIIRRPDLPDSHDEYEVQFGFNRALLYGSQLKAAVPSAVNED
jgi:hypothetical protein